MMPGTDVKVALLRDGKEQTVAVRLGEAQGSRAQREDGASSPDRATDTVSRSSR